MIPEGLPVVSVAEPGGGEGQAGEDPDRFPQHPHAGRQGEEPARRGIEIEVGPLPRSPFDEGERGGVGESPQEGRRDGKKHPGRVMGPQDLRSAPEAHQQGDRRLAHLEGADGLSAAQRLEDDGDQVEGRQGEGQQRRLGHAQDGIALGQLARTAGHEDQGQHRAIQGKRGHPAHA